jgi:hypothetical protein
MKDFDEVLGGLALLQEEDNGQSLFPADLPLPEDPEDEPLMHEITRKAEKTTREEIEF